MKKIAWFIPRVTKGSGGHRTIIQQINILNDNGYTCDIYVKNDVDFTPEEIKKQINDFYMPCSSKVYKGWKTDNEYDIVFASSWDTVEPAKKVKSKEKFYFIQDYEPWFFSMGDDYLFAENTYKENFKAITIGKWLSYKINKEFNMKTSYFNFCADLNIYNKKKVQKENAICAIFQPNKFRRCSNLLLQTIEIVNKVNPEIKIYLYGSEKQDLKNVKVEELGILTPEELNDLYNKCKLGVSMSSSNPSRIPFEMMASGLPVIDLYRENNLYDLPEDSCILSECTPNALATTILDLFNDKEKQKEMSENAARFMKNYPLEYGYKQFIDSFNKELSNEFKTEKIEKLYNKKMSKSKKKYEVIKDFKNKGDSISIETIMKNYDNEITTLTTLLNEANNQIDSILNSKRWKLSGIILAPLKIFKK